MTRQPKSWSSPHVTALEPERQADAATPGGAGDDQEPFHWDNCDMCAGTGWASYPDPFFGGALIEARCPACVDTTVRARKRRWENNDGRKVGPK